MPNLDEPTNINKGSERIEQIQILINVFKMERVIYVILTTFQHLLNLEGCQLLCFEN